MSPARYTPLNPALGFTESVLEHLKTTDTISFITYLHDFPQYSQSNPADVSFREVQICTINSLCYDLIESTS